MERLKNPVRIVLFLCSAAMACNREDPKTPDWRDRVIQARLTGAEWQQVAASPELRTSCDEPDSRETALNLLVAAGGDCLDKAVNAIGRHAKEDLAAAYLTRYERKRDAVDLLKALETAQGFNRALALEWLGLTKEAIASWNSVAAEKTGWSREAREHIAALQQRPDPIRQWNPGEVEEAVKRRDAAALTTIARAFPADAARWFEKSDLSDREGARLLAKILAAEGEQYPQAVMEAMERTRNPAALEQGLAAMRAKDYHRADVLLERAGNPLYLAARYYAFTLPALTSTLPHLKPEYRELSSRIQTFRANLLEFEDRYFEAHDAYEHALAAAKGDPTATVEILSRRSVNYALIGATEKAFADAHQNLGVLERVAGTDARHLAYGAAAIAVGKLGYPLVAFEYQNTAVEDCLRAVADAEGGEIATAKHELSVALRARAETQIALGHGEAAKRDLEQAADLAEAIAKPIDRDLVRMRLHDVRGQTLLKTNPIEAAKAFTDAIALAKGEHSTYRATLHFQRATARRSAGDRQHADDDLAAAQQMLRDQVYRTVEENAAAAYKPLWDLYFLRFQETYSELIESRLAAGDVDEAFVYSELARSFEPMQILLQSGSVPPNYHAIETTADLDHVRANLPEDTVILQYLVLRERTYTWVVTRGESIRLVSQRATKAQVERWVKEAHEAVAAGQRPPFVKAVRAVYSELFREPLELAAGKTRIVIVPDVSMQGLPFNALESTTDGYLLERGSIATAGSTSLYLYMLARDKQLSVDRAATVLLVGDPAFPLFPKLPFAREEVQELARDYYPGAEVLSGTAATVGRFLAQAKRATIVHFAGHALASPEAPWQSRLLLAPEQQESGELTAQRLMRELPQLLRTRLVVLGACSTAGGGSVGPQGLAPLVRPLIAADVPAVLGSLWDVRDASAKELLVSFHCHYRHGDDVAVALRQAQLEMLRNDDRAWAWAAFQVIGYAASPYPRPTALEDPNIEHACTQNSLLWPDGLHSR